MAQVITTTSRRLIIGPRGLRKPARPILDTRDPINRRLVGCWLLGDVATGITSDLTGQHNATLVGGPSLSAAHHGGQALVVNGSSQYADTGITDLSYSSGTMAWWQYPTVAYNNGSPRGCWGQATATHDMSAIVYSDNNWYVGWWSNASDTRLTFAANASNWPQNTWTMYALAWTAASQTLYQNGGTVLATSGVAPQIFNIGSDLNLCFTNPSAPRYFTGRQDGYRLFNRALSVSEIARLYAEPYAGIYEAARWRVGVAAAGGSFNPGWAYGATRTIGMGVY